MFLYTLLIQVPIISAQSHIIRIIMKYFKYVLNIRKNSKLFLIHE